MGAALSYGTGVPRAQLAAMVVGGGGGERLGGVSKPDLVFGGVRLVDRVCCALGEVAGAGVVAIVPPSVRVPSGVTRALEDPPGGGPLAGIDAGLAALSVGADCWVIVVSVDCPALRTFCAASWPNPWVSRATGASCAAAILSRSISTSWVSTVPGRCAALSTRPWRVMGAFAVWGCAGFCVLWRSSGWM